jgi:shikimate kinase
VDNLILIGMPSAGKSTVGVLLAKKMGYDFIDTDLLIQKQEGKLLRELIAEHGSEGFLKIENQVNRDLMADRAVIAPGGSVVYCEEAMLHYKEIGKIVYLKVSFENIEKRIGNPRKRGVVLAEGQTLRDLYEERTVLFEKYADIVIDEGNLSLDDTITKVLRDMDWDSGEMSTK